MYLCLQTGAPADMPRFLKLREFPDFIERWEKPMYISQGALGKLYRATIQVVQQTKQNKTTSRPIRSWLADAYDPDLIVDGYENFPKAAKSHKEQYIDKMGSLMNYYGADSEVEILTGERVVVHKFTGNN
ncbi:probable RNA-dependent RNA polymerase 2 [Primulina huaijiensis]|uniref:probable RNA-dependent RNA polymerase 2 n=1 Tax=Primulina huaijiensis TaxID=1492673 RepID=UPI003CC6EC9A